MFQPILFFHISPFLFFLSLKPFIVSQNSDMFLLFSSFFLFLSLSVSFFSTRISLNLFLSSHNSNLSASSLVLAYFFNASQVFFFYALISPSHSSPSPLFIYFTIFSSPPTSHIFLIILSHLSCNPFAWSPKISLNSFIFSR